ncbi:MAG: CRISPR-associated endonuclease Cas1 [Dehalococcoidales bacterium]|nr:CRISPR-associated endonuclease Cas1 [Dehalococcoidales bacterium]
MQPLIVDQFGVFVGKKSERVQVQKKGELLTEVPLIDLEQLLIAASGVGLSSDVIYECGTRGIPITFLTGRGEPYATVISTDLTGTVATRREQLLAYTDERGLALAKAFVRGKLANQVNLLRYVAKYRHEAQPAVYEELRRAATDVQDLAGRVDGVPGATLDDARAELMGVEGLAARRYWEALRQVVPADVGWPGREHRGATDLVNCLLNYGYGILYGQVERAIVLAGLDPYGGYLHVDRPGKPSLVLDLIEEFRQMVVDRTVLALLGRHGELTLDEDGRLDTAARKTLAAKLFERLDGEEPYEGNRHKVRTIIQLQARHLATFVRRERPAYKAWVGRW